MKTRPKSAIYQSRRTPTLPNPQTSYQISKRVSHYRGDSSGLAQYARGRPLTALNPPTYQSRDSRQPSSTSRRQVVFSAINPDLKQKMRQHVPLYKERIMGHVMYQESESKIVSSKPTEFLYRPNTTTLDICQKSKQQRKQRRIKSRNRLDKQLYQQETKLDGQFFLKLASAFDKSTPSIMKMNRMRDKRLNEKVSGLMKITNNFQDMDSLNTRTQPSHSNYIPSLDHGNSAQQLQYQREDLAEGDGIHSTSYSNKYRSQSRKFGLGARQLTRRPKSKVSLAFLQKIKSLKKRNGLSQKEGKKERKYEFRNDENFVTLQTVKQ